jgi:hypothetical protein
MTPLNVNRREFVKLGAAGTTAVMLGPQTPCFRWPTKWVSA